MASQWSVLILANVFQFIKCTKMMYTHWGVWPKHPRFLGHVWQGQPMHYTLLPMKPPTDKKRWDNFGDQNKWWYQASLFTWNGSVFIQGWYYCVPKQCSGTWFTYIRCIGDKAVTQHMRPHTTQHNTVAMCYAHSRWQGIESTVPHILALTWLCLFTQQCKELTGKTMSSTTLTTEEWIRCIHHQSRVFGMVSTSQQQLCQV